jgi:hypothetical protein
MRTLIILLLLAVTTAVTAQIQRGDHLLRLTFDHSTVSDNLATFHYRSGVDITNLTIAPNYGFALTDRLVVGGQIQASVFRFSGETSGELGLSPYLRYYPVNTDRLGVFVEAMTTIGVSDGDFVGGDLLDLTAGLQLPLAPGLRVGPDLRYAVREGWNTVSLAARLELVLGGRTRQETVPVAQLRRGSLLIGGQRASFNLRRDAKIFFGGFDLAAHYFLTDRLAGVGGIGFTAARASVGTTVGDMVISAWAPSITAGARYYLSQARSLVWFTEARATYSVSISSTPGVAVNERVNSTNLSIGGGGQYWLRDRVALEFGPEFRRILTSNEFDVDASLFSLNLGVRFLLR